MNWPGGSFAYLPPTATSKKEISGVQHHNCQEETEYLPVEYRLTDSRPQSKERPGRKSFRKIKSYSCFLKEVWFSIASTNQCSVESLPSEGLVCWGKLIANLSREAAKKLTTGNLETQGSGLCRNHSSDLLAVTFASLPWRDATR